jgi:hypothetical protein
VIPSNNKELYAYLVNLSEELKKRGAKELSEEAASASRLMGFMTTETLAEIRISLRRIVRDGQNVLNPTEQTDMEEVLRQLTASINRRTTQP